MSKVYRCRMTEYIEFNILADDEDQVEEWITTHSINNVRELSSEYKEDYDEEILSIEKEKDADIDIREENKIEVEDAKRYEPNEKGFTVYLRSGSVKHEFAWFPTEKEAIEFCEAYNWEYADENTFVWDMEIEEE